VQYLKAHNCIAIQSVERSPTIAEQPAHLLKNQAQRAGKIIEMEFNKKNKSRRDDIEIMNK
jgi:hypothetical protein